MTERRGPGRPPDLAKRAAVLDATLATLADVGYAGLAIDAVAQAAGVARSFVYRVWESRTALVRDALFAPLDDLPVPDLGDTVADLEAWVRAHVEVMHRPAHVKGLPGLTIDLQHDPEAYRYVYRRYQKPTEDGFGVILDRGRARGEAIGPIDPRVLSAVMSGSTSMLAQMPGSTVEATVEIVMVALLRGLVAGTGA